MISFPIYSIAVIVIMLYLLDITSGQAAQPVSDSSKENGNPSVQPVAALTPGASVSVNCIKGLKFNDVDLYSCLEETPPTKNNEKGILLELLFIMPQVHLIKLLDLLV
jgi:hypothetical protein